MFLKDKKKYRRNVILCNIIVSI